MLEAISASARSAISKLQQLAGENVTVRIDEEPGRETFIKFFDHRTSNIVGIACDPAEIESQDYGFLYGVWTRASVHLARHICGKCNKSFLFRRSLDQMMGEAVANFGEETLRSEPLMFVCDDCYEELMELHRTSGEVK